MRKYCGHSRSSVCFECKGVEMNVFLFVFCVYIYNKTIKLHVQSMTALFNYDRIAFQFTAFIDKIPNAHFLFIIL